MKLKRHYYNKSILTLISIVYTLVIISSLIIIISIITDLNDRVKVPGIYKENTICYTTLNNELIAIKDNTINVYQENEEIYVYYCKDDVMKIITSTEVKMDIKPSIIQLFFYGIPWTVFLVLYINKIKKDKEIVRKGKHIHININKIEEINDKKFGKYKIITANYIDENNKEYNFVSDKIYDNRQMKEIKETGSVHIYYMPNNLATYVMYEYSNHRTLDWYGE